MNKESLEYCKEGKISCIAECNPLHGPRVDALIKALERGEQPDKFNYVDEKIYSSIPDVASVTVDGETYPIEKP